MANIAGRDDDALFATSLVVSKEKLPGSQR
jgi:hypothetical protein